MDEDPQENLLDLTAAERMFRKVADDARVDAAAGLWVSDTAECHRLVVEELDRLRERLHELEGEGPMDEKSRGPAYRRGYADGRLAERAGLAWSEQCSRVEAYYVGGSSTDQPPFAPELADAPLVTGESGAPAPLVVDHPAHESTLPAELSAGLTAEVEVEDYSPVEPDVPGYDDGETDPGPRP